ncbi:MAG: DUF5671 domain-containing protein [Candidatus Paceibacterota bacterium]
MTQKIAEIFYLKERARCVDKSDASFVVIAILLIARHKKRKFKTMNHTNSAGQPTPSNIESYIRRGIAQGVSHEEIANNLRAAGWREDVIDRAFVSVAENPQPRNADFFESPEGGRASFLFVLSFLTLYISVWAFINTSFGVIDNMFGVSMNEAARTSFRWSIAWLVVVFPIFLITNYYIKKVVPAGTENIHLTGTRRTLTYVTLFIATITLIGSAVFVVFQLTGGEVVMKTILKIFTIILVAASLFGYYFNDLRGRVGLGDVPR